MALKIAVFGFTRLAYAAEINFTTCDLCLRNPNAIALHEEASALDDCSFAVAFASMIFFTSSKFHGLKSCVSTPTSIDSARCIQPGSANSPALQVYAKASHQNRARRHFAGVPMLDAF